MTRVAESEFVQMAIGEAAAAIDAATLLLHTGRDASTAAVSSGRKITEAEALRARRDMVYAQHQVGWAVDRLCEVDGARWVYDSDPLEAIRRDVMTILTHTPPAVRRRWRPTAACCSPSTRLASRVETVMAPPRRSMLGVKQDDSGKIGTYSGARSAGDPR